MMFKEDVQSREAVKALLAHDFIAKNELSFNLFLLVNFFSCSTRGAHKILIKFYLSRYLAGC